MPWISSFNNPSIPHWILSGTAMSIHSSILNTILCNLTWQGSTNKLFNSNRTYQVETYVKDFYTQSASFSVTVPVGGERFQYISGAVPSSPGNGYLYFYTNPVTNINSFSYVRYTANSRFGSNTSPTEGIYNMRLNELKWRVQGFSWFRISPTASINPSNDSLGWHYDGTTNTFLWYDHPSNPIYPAGGSYNNKIANQGYRSNNYIARDVNFAFFNLSFSYQKVGGSASDAISIYLSPNLPSSGASSFTPPIGSTLIATMSYTGVTFSAFYGLPGNQYVFIVGPTTSNLSGVIFTLTELKIDGGYHPGNNRRYLMTNSDVYSDPTILSPIGLTGATYTAYSGYGNTINATNSLTIFSINSMIGNGTFKSGIWENGVWNSGWRYDDTLYEFYSIGDYFDYNKGKNWRFLLNGPTSSVSNFNIGDKVSIGNIVSIDINEDRKFIKNYFTIVNKTETSIVVELTNNFPLRRIEVDSPYHRIYVTKNVWLSGGFLNGYFRGVWNYGLFKGYPKITEMYDSHWIDGIFDGGHFYADQLQVEFTDTLNIPPSGNVGDLPKLGLSFSIPHRLNDGDTIFIQKLNSNTNPQYNGWTKVRKVINEYQIVTEKDYGNIATGSEPGILYTNISSGLIQNFDFNSNNVSKITSAQSLDSSLVFTYNSWIDVNYTNHSSVSIGKPQFQMDFNTNKPYSENNLYGYPSFDILSSNSRFRDSFTIQNRTYKLGTKYKIFNDYIGDSSTFQDPLGFGTPSLSSIPSIKADDILLTEQGWTYSRVPSITNPSFFGFTISRTIDYGVDPIVGEELKIEAQADGGVLDIIPTESIINRTPGQIEKFRYSMVEFDLVTYSVNDETYAKKSSIVSGADAIIEPVLHFNNLNFIKRDVIYPSGVYTTILPASYLPVNENINHLTTEWEGDITKKYEYFYNKRNLSMYFRGSGLFGGSQSIFVIDNLKFYEIDMIPFFKYFNENTINMSIQVPYQGIAPFIDYTNSNFSFIDNISIGLSSIQSTQSFTPFSGVGISIGTPISTPINIVDSLSS